MIERSFVKKKMEEKTPHKAIGKPDLQRSQNAGEAPGTAWPKGSSVTSHLSPWRGIKVPPRGSVHALNQKAENTSQQLQNARPPPGLAGWFCYLSDCDELKTIQKTANKQLETQIPTDSILNYGCSSFC